MEREGDPGRAHRRCREWCEWRAGLLGRPIPPGALFSTRQGQGPIVGEFRVIHPPRFVDMPDGGPRRFVHARAETVAEVPLPWHAMPHPGRLDRTDIPIPGGETEHDVAADGAAGAARDGGGRDTT